MTVPELSIGYGARCLIIAEAGVNHNGCVERAKQMIDAAHAAGADAVKFQTFTARELVTAQAPGADYQQRNTGRAVTQLEMLRELELSHSDCRLLQTYACSLGITFLSTPFDIPSVDFLDELDVPLFKIGSGELTHHSLLRHVARKQKPVILSTGMADLEEIREAVRVIRAEQAPLTLLHCVSNYPADPASLNLRAIQTLEHEFGVPVGFSDHTAGIHLAPVAVALGACVIEKHFTLSRSLPGPDHLASIEPDDLREMVSAIRDAEAALGDGVKVPAASELSVAAAARRSWVAALPLPAGTVLHGEHLVLRRPGTGLCEQELPLLLGKTLCRPLQEGSVLSRNDVKETA